MNSGATVGTTPPAGLAVCPASTTVGLGSAPSSSRTHCRPTRAGAPGHGLCLTFPRRPQTSSLTRSGPLSVGPSLASLAGGEPHLCPTPHPLMTSRSCLFPALDGKSAKACLSAVLAACSRCLQQCPAWEALRCNCPRTD